eukprot:1173690-Prorocentrum_minimum.AAC.1
MLLCSSKNCSPHEAYRLYCFELSQMLSVAVPLALLAERRTWHVARAALNQMRAQLAAGNPGSAGQRHLAGGGSSHPPSAGFDGATPGAGPAAPSAAAGFGFAPSPAAGAGGVPPRNPRDLSFGGPHGIPLAMSARVTQRPTLAKTGRHCF